MGKIIKNRVEYGGSSNSAENIKYDDTKNVKEAINEVKSEIVVVSNNLEKASQTKRLSNVSVLSVVKNGKYYVGGAMDIPSGSSSFGYLDVHVYDDNDTNRKITWTPVNSNVTYTNIKEGDTWLGWDSYAKNSDLNNKIKVTTITGSTGTGSGAGLLSIPRTEYPNAIAIIPFGYDFSFDYRIGAYDISSNNFKFGVQKSVSGEWADTVTVVFYALVIE